MVRIASAARHLVNALLNDAEALAHFLDMYDGAVIAVPGAANRDVKVELVIACIRLLLAEVPFEASSAKVWAGHSPFNGFIYGATADALCAHFENMVAHDGALVFVESRWQVLDEVAEHTVPSVGQVLCYAANAEPVWVHTRAANSLHDSHGLLTVIEHEEDRGHLANVLREDAVPDQVVHNPEEFCQHDAYHLAARRHCDACQLFDRG